MDTSSNGGYNLLTSLKPNLCTMIDLAFAKVDPSGNVLASDVPSKVLTLILKIFSRKFAFFIDLSSFLKFKGTSKAPKMLLSLGGAADWWSLQNFAKIAASPALREAFANSCLETCQKYGLSGIDVDWEFPSASDKSNFVELLKAAKAKLGPAGYLLTIAVGASNWWAVWSGGLDIPGVGGCVFTTHLK